MFLKTSLNFNFRVEIEERKLRSPGSKSQRPPRCFYCSFSYRNKDMQKKIGTTPLMFPPHPSFLWSAQKQCRWINITTRSRKNWYFWGFGVNCAFGNALHRVVVCTWHCTRTMTTSDTLTHTDAQPHTYRWWHDETNASVTSLREWVTHWWARHHWQAVKQLVWCFPLIKWSHVNTAVPLMTSATSAASKGKFNDARLASQSPQSRLVFTSQQWGSQGDLQHIILIPTYITTQAEVIYSSCLQYI